MADTRRNADQNTVNLLNKLQTVFLERHSSMSKVSLRQLPRMFPWRGAYASASQHNVRPDFLFIGQFLHCFRDDGLVDGRTRTE